jgi:hypothetical protein
MELVLGIITAAIIKQKLIKLIHSILCLLIRLILIIFLFYKAVMSYGVYLIKCTGCQGFLSLRGKNIYVLSKEDLKGYATDLCTNLVMEAKLETKF